MNITKPELDVGLATRSLPALSAFYRDLLGLSALPPQPTGGLAREARFAIGGHALKLYDFTEPPAACEGGVDKAIGMRLLAFVLDDLDAVLARFDAAGHAYRRLSLPDTLPYRVAFSTDADGNALELVGLRKPAGEALRARLQVGLTVADVARSRRFYGELLGFPEQPPMTLPRSMGVLGDARYGFTAGSTTIKLWARPEALPTWTGAPGKRTGIRLVTAFVDDVDAAHEALRARGVTVKVPPMDFQGRARLMFLADPDGNWIELATLREG